MTDTHATPGSAPRRRLRIGFADFWPNFDPDDNFFLRVLRRRFDVTVVDEPDVLLYSCFGRAHLAFNGMRVLYSAENRRPDFSRCDYAMTCDRLDHPRHYRVPAYAPIIEPEQLVKRDFNPERILASKIRFCNFVYSNPRCRRRNRFFRALSKYKRVDSGGRLMNNMGEPVADKSALQRQCKFTIAFENTSHPGYTTEKIVHAMVAETVPIYWGDPVVHMDFNPASFLNHHDAGSDDALIERVIELDRDDEQYLRALAEPWCHDNRPPAALDPEPLLDWFETVLDSSRPPVARSAMASFVRRSKDAGRLIPRSSRWLGDRLRGRRRLEGLDP